MPLLTEQERLVNSEVNFINDSTVYTLNISAWATVKDYGNVTLPSDGLLLISLSSYGAGKRYVRVKVGSKYALSISPSAQSVTDFTAIFLTAGTYDILVEGTTDTNPLSITNMQVGFVSFNDLQASALNTYSSGIALTVANRDTPAGALLNATWLVQVFANTAAGQTNFENVGDTLTNGVSIAIDGNQVNWSDRQQDTDSKGAASARLGLPYSVGSSHTVTITKRNANTAVTISVVACPWILPSTSTQVLTFNFSQGSTFYCSLEPLFDNPTKTVAIGVVRGVDFGSSSDYYSTQSGTGLIQYSFTMDVVDVAINALFNGFGGCIGYVSADVR